MATSRYDVEYADGRKRVKLLTPESADKLGEQKGVKSVKRQNSGAASGRRRGNQGDDD